MRVQQIRNIGSIEGNKPVSPQKWEEVTEQGDAAVKKWIDDNMTGKSCVVVLVGEETANRKWVKHEIKKAWEDGKGLLGIYIHNINCANNGTCTKGTNPFDQFTFDGGKKLSSVVKCHNLGATSAYGDISDNIDSWIDAAIEARK
jgi:hypothetical protein